MRAGTVGNLILFSHCTRAHNTLRVAASLEAHSHFVKI